MIGLRRTTVVRIAHVRYMAVALSNSSCEHLKGEPFAKDNGRDFKKFLPALPAEHFRLENKHRDALQSNKADTLQEIIEHIEWRGFVYSQIPEKIAKRIGDPREDLTSLSDRQLSVLLSTFGSVCDSVGSLHRTVFMAKALHALQQRGVKLGPLSRNAVLSARIDNGENVDVIEELAAWETANLSPDVETFGCLSKVYAHKANIQGILDIISYMKSNGMGVSETVLESFVYSVARSGHYGRAESLVEKFAANANEVLLRTAIARAAIARNDFSVVINTLASIPNGAKLNQVSNNLYILYVLFDMLEAGEMDAVEKISPYLTMSSEGPFLAEWHVNPKVLARARRACAEGKLDCALKLYGLLHPKFKSSNFESSLLDALGNHLEDTGLPIDVIFALAASMEKIGLMKDHNLFLLERSIGSARVCEVITSLRLSGNLEKCLLEKPSLRKGLARGLSEKFTNPNLKKEERIALLVDLATVLFSYDSERTAQDIIEFYPVVYVLGGKDINLAISALTALQSGNIRKEFTTALIQQLLKRGDPLADDKLERLLSSDVVESVSISRIHKQISGLVQNRANKEGESDVHQLKIAARLFALSFPPENSKMKSAIAIEYVVSQLQSQLLSTARARLLISFMEKEPRIRFSPEDVAVGKKSLVEKGQRAKAELLERLKRRSQTYSRWLEASVEELEQEFAHICENPNHKPAVVTSIHEVILRKISVEKVINHARVEHHLRLIKESTSSPSSRVNDFARQIFSNAMCAALTDHNFDVAQRLWEIRPAPTSVEDTLTYIAHLVLSGRQEADVVAEDLRNTAETITASTLQMVGDRLGDSWSMAEMRHLTQYLKTKFNLTPQQLLKLILPMKLRQLGRLIEGGKLEEALQLVVEQTVESNSAFGQYELAAAAIRAENMGVLKSVFDVVKRTHGKEIAFLDLAMVLLEEGRAERAFKLLDVPQLKISERKLEYFIRRATESNRSDVLRGLFIGLSKDERASSVGLNRLLLQLCRLYYKANNFAELESLEKEIERISFPLDRKMRIVFENIHQAKLEGR